MIAVAVVQSLVYEVVETLNTFSSVRSRFYKLQYF